MGQAVGMNIVLVNPPNHHRDRVDIAPPLGLLSLAAPLLREGFSVKILDYNLSCCSGAFPTNDDFYTEAVREILAHQPDILGFTSMAINSHVSLELARQVKERDSRVLTIFGGPHFAAIARDLLVEFPWVDNIAVGEGEKTFLEFAKNRRKGVRASSPILVPPEENSAVQNAEHPWLAYSLIEVDSYFAVNPRCVLNFEMGRGCKYRCSFCYSPGFFRRYNFAISDVRDDVRKSVGIGAKHLFFVNDNILNYYEGSIELCRSLSTVENRPSWNAYATLRDLTPTIAQMLSTAGCNALYFGVDAVTPAQKRELGKYAIRSLEETSDTAKMLVGLSIVPTMAFIIDPSRWALDEISESLRWACRLRLEGAEISLHYLTPYASTRLQTMRGHENPGVPDDFRVRATFDCPEVVCKNPFATGAPHLFPFHARSELEATQYRTNSLFVLVAQEILTQYPYELWDLLSDGESLAVHLRKIADHLDPGAKIPSDPLLLKAAAREQFEETIQRVFGFIAS